MAFTDYLIAAPWWHWLMAVLILAVGSKWRPIKIVRNVHHHDHKHIHQEKDES